MTKQTLTDKQYAALGEHAAAILRLKRDRKNKRFDTTWGTFIASGLGKVLERLVDEARAASKTIVTLVPRWDKVTGYPMLVELDEHGDLTAYTWQEQHSSASREWFYTKTRPADPADKRISSLWQHYLTLPGDGSALRLGTRLARPRSHKPAPDKAR